MSDQLRGVVVSHASLAQALVESVVTITGEDDALVAISNQGMSPDTLCQAIAAAVDTGPAVVFVDMPAGSCLKATLTELRERSQVAVVAGVNLPMLLDFVYRRGNPPEVAARRAVQHGSESIKSVLP